MTGPSYLVDLVFNYNMFHNNCVKTCLRFVSTSRHFGENRPWPHPCQVQKTQFYQFIGPEIGDLIRCSLMVL
jgi:hypothetical protein